VTSEELAAIRARVEIADRDDSYLRSYTGASNADLYRHPQVRADMRALLNEVARLTAEVERLRSDYEHGHAAGDAARMQRCKQDVARALRLDGESPPVWGDLVAEVARAAMRAAAKAVRGES
jgi:hypothetical protein